MNRFRLSILVVAAFFIAANALTVKAACTYHKVIQGEELEIGIMLSWSTEAEENNARFIVEKSHNGIDFTDVGTVEGAGNTLDTKDYNFLDVMSRAEKIYYRLKQVDFDGRYLYSEILSMQKEKDNQFMVVRMSSIVASDNFDVTINTLDGGSMVYTLLDAQGTPVETANTQLLNGLNFITVDLEQRKPGIYKLQLQMENEVETLVFQKTTNDNFIKQNIVSNRKINP